MGVFVSHLYTCRRTVPPDVLIQQARSSSDMAHAMALLEPQLPDFTTCDWVPTDWTLLKKKQSGEATSTSTTAVPRNTALYQFPKAMVAVGRAPIKTPGRTGLLMLVAVALLIAAGCRLNLSSLSEIRVDMLPVSQGVEPSFSTMTSNLLTYPPFEQAVVVAAKQKTKSFHNEKVKISFSKSMKMAVEAQQPVSSSFVFDAEPVQALVAMTQVLVVDLPHRVQVLWNTVCQRVGRALSWLINPQLVEPDEEIASFL